jgi:V/A-type H+-transporting ATPase subunit C
MNTTSDVELLEFREDNAYAFATGSVRARERRLLDAATLARLVEAEDAQEVWQLLRDAGFESAAEYDLERYEEALARELRQLYAYLRFLSPKREETAWLGKRYDFHNLKACLKAYLWGEDPAEALIDGVGEVPVDLIRAAVRTAEWSALPDELSEAGRAAAAEYERTGEPESIDVLIDRAMLRSLKTAVETAVGESAALTRLIRAWCDLANLRITLRARAMGKDLSFLERAWVEPGGLDRDRLHALREAALDAWPDLLRATGYAELIAQTVRSDEAWDPAAFEKGSDEFVLELLQPARYVLYGPEPLVAYVLAREIELKNLRIVLVGKMGGVSSEELKGWVRAGYA